MQPRRWVQGRPPQGHFFRRATFFSAVSTTLVVSDTSFAPAFFAPAFASLPDSFAASVAPFFAPAFRSFPLSLAAAAPTFFAPFSASPMAASFNDVSALGVLLRSTTSTPLIPVDRRMHPASRGHRPHSPAAPRIRSRGLLPLLPVRPGQRRLRTPGETDPAP